MHFATDDILIEMEKQQLSEETQNQYQLVSKIGIGAYGSVFLGFDGQNRCTLKRVENIFRSTTDAKRILREIRILNNLRHENIINLVNVTSTPDFSKFQNLVIVYDYMESTLTNVIHANPFLTVEHHQYFIYQILRGLKYLHSANILHRDLKPENILVNSNCDLRICDFGLARVSGTGGRSSAALSQYVTTRWYRAPEILLCYDEYDTSIDIWSVGCILAQLMLQKPLFQGTETKEQLILITQFLGSPTDEDLRDCTNENALAFMNSLPEQRGVVLEEVFSNSPPEEIDLLSKMLCWDPTKRITVTEALEHAFLATLHSEDDEPVAQPIDFEFENENITMSDLKFLLWQEVLTYHPEFQSP